MRVLLAFLLGGLTAFVVTLLFAPESGEETRKKLSEELKRMRLELEAQKEKSVDALNTWKTSAEELLETSAKNLNGSDTTVVDV